MTDNYNDVQYNEIEKEDLNNKCRLNSPLDETSINQISNDNDDDMECEDLSDVQWSATKDNVPQARGFVTPDLEFSSKEVKDHVYLAPTQMFMANEQSRETSQKSKKYFEAEDDFPSIKFNAQQGVAKKMDE